MKQACDPVLHNFVMYSILIISDIMISRAILEKPTLVNFLKTSNNTHPWDSCFFEVSEKLTRACFFPNCTQNHAITYTNCLLYNTHFLNLPHTLKIIRTLAAASTKSVGKGRFSQTNSSFCNKKKLNDEKT